MQKTALFFLALNVVFSQSINFLSDDRRGSASLDSQNNSASFNYRSRDRNSSARFDENGILIRDQDRASEDSDEDVERKAEEQLRAYEEWVEENNPELAALVA